MQLIDHPFRVGIILVEDVLALAIPPEPVLHDVIDGNVQLAVFPRDPQNFFLRLVAVLALPEAIGPFAEHGRLPGQLAVGGDDLVKIGAVEKVVVDVVGHFGTDVQVIRKAVIEPAARVVVPENAIALARNQQRDRDIGIVLRNVDRLAAIVPDARLVLAEPVEGLARAVNVDERFRAISVLAIDLDRRQLPCRLPARSCLPSRSR